MSAHASSNQLPDHMRASRLPNRVARDAEARPARCGIEIVQLDRCDELSKAKLRRAASRDEECRVAIHAAGTPPGGLSDLGRIGPDRQCGVQIRRGQNKAAARATKSGRRGAPGFRKGQSGISNGREHWRLRHFRGALSMRVRDSIAKVAGTDVSFAGRSAVPR